MQPRNPFLLSTPAAAGLPAVDAEACNADNADPSWEEKLSAYITALKRNLTEEKQLGRKREQDIEILRVALDHYKLETRALQGETTTLHQRVAELDQDIERNEKIHEWRIQELQAQLRQAKESHEAQLVLWMEQVNTLHKKVHMLERRST